jgi:hypothetical protein
MLASSCAGCAVASPCDGMRPTLTAADKSALAPALATQLSTPRVDLLDEFRSGDWQIVYVDSHVADEAFLFYHGDPRTARYITLWSGGAAPGEEASIRAWTIAHAPGIPSALAACFAWHVTKDR